MTIEELAAATGLTANDLLGIWDTEASGSTEPTQKITAQQLAAAVKVLADLQGALTFDSVPTTGSTNPVTSGGIKNAIANSQQSSEIDLSKFTNIDSHVTQTRFFSWRVDNVVYLSFNVAGGITDSTKLFDIDSSIRPRQQMVVCPLFNSSNGYIYANGSVWIEFNTPGKVTYYGATLPSGGYYCCLSYVI